MLGQTLIKKEIGERLKQARIQAGYSDVNEFCKKYNIVPELYLQHEQGERAIKVSDAQQYCRFLKISLNWLLLGTKKE